jgi:hypothetical protein
LFNKGLRVRVFTRDLKSLMYQASDAQQGSLREYWLLIQEAFLELRTLQPYFIRASLSGQMIEPRLGDPLSF